MTEDVIGFECLDAASIKRLFVDWLRIKLFLF
jgi:hypothetical protein